MIATLAWWDLTGSNESAETLRQYLADEGIAPWEEVEGMLLKIWISDPKSNRWGAIMLWETPEAARAPLPPNRAQERIGYPPEIRMLCDVEAVVGSIFPSRPNVLGLAQSLANRLL